MKRLASLVGVMAIGLLGAAGCAIETVGDPCAPGRPGNAPCGSGDGGGCFLGTEIYIETQSLECRSRICLVYRYAEETGRSAAERAKHVYCTCRCGVPPSLAATTESSVLCTCPDTFSCISIAGEQYNEGVRGSYCVRSNTVLTAPR